MGRSALPGLVPDPESDPRLEGWSAGGRGGKKEAWVYPKRRSS